MANTDPLTQKRSGPKTMATPPDWVRALKPASPQGTTLLSAERSRSSLSVPILSAFLFTQEKIDKSESILKALQGEPVFDKGRNYFDGRVDKFKTALARAKVVRRLQKKLGWDYEGLNMAQDLISEPGPYGLHSSMGITTLRDQGTPEQHELFLKPAEDYKYIMCYAQTELGHGSNLRGIETTATYNPSNNTFTMHSPTLTASKWWIGSLGRTANHAVVMAQLIVRGKYYGPHPFVVPVRDVRTHEVLEGRHVGDLGPKLGYNTMDNGFLLLNKVEIPHVNMLARWSHVDPETNTYVPPKSIALTYGTMTWVRSTIVLQAGVVLARGVTIATRYCAVRRQFQDKDAKEGAEESPVLDYTTVQYRLFSNLATAFAFHFTGKAMMKMYEEKQNLVNSSPAAKSSIASNEKSPKSTAPEETSGGGGADILADLHAVSCGLKALASTVACEGLTTCRRTCGGHGFSSFSGIGSFEQDYNPTVTWEGDSMMITQQVARYLLKCARSVYAGKRPNNDATTILATFLEKSKTGKPSFDVINKDTDIVAAFAWRSAAMTFDCLKRRDQDKVSWNSLLVDFWRLSTAHSQYLVVKFFHETIQGEDVARLPEDIRSILLTLFRFYAFYTLENSGLEFLASGACTKQQVATVRNDRVPTLMSQIRPHAVRLVDSWNFSDWQLDSSLGRFDGNVYEDLFSRASFSERNPLNLLTVDPSPESDVLIKRDETGGEVRAKL